MERRARPELSHSDPPPRLLTVVMPRLRWGDFAPNGSFPSVPMDDSEYGPG